MEELNNVYVLYCNMAVFWQRGPLSSVGRALDSKSKGHRFKSGRGQFTFAHQLHAGGGNGQKDIIIFDYQSLSSEKKCWLCLGILGHIRRGVLFDNNIFCILTFGTSTMNDHVGTSFVCYATEIHFGSVPSDRDAYACGILLASTVY